MLTPFVIPFRDFFILPRTVPPGQGEDWEYRGVGDMCIISFLPHAGAGLWL